MTRNTEKGVFASLIGAAAVPAGNGLPQGPVL